MINIKDAEAIFRMTQPKLKKYLREWLVERGYSLSSSKKDRFIYAKGNCPVCLVAHMDTVHKNPVSKIIKAKGGKWSAIEGIGGDDRCGIIIIKTLIEKGYRPFVIFTEDEETGGEGAVDFIKRFPEAPKKIKFLVEFDRKGKDDCVFYDCDNGDFEKYITSFGFHTSWGSFSDISVIAPDWGVAAVNLSSGYYNAHTLNEYILLPDMEKIIKKGVNILEDAFKSTTIRYEYIESPLAGRVYGFGNYDYYDWGDTYMYYGCREFDIEHQSTSTIKKGKSTASFVDVSPLESGYIVMDDGDMISIDCWDDGYYIDSDGYVYIWPYDYVTSGLVRISGIAYTPNGIPARYNEADSEAWPLMKWPEEE